MKQKPPGKRTEREMVDETLAYEPGVDSRSDGDFAADGMPQSIGRYEIQKLLGRGGMGSVYLARDSQLQREVALKIPKFGSGTNEKLVARFYREARSAANLSHPNLCPVFDVGEIDGTHYIAMAYIKGRTLSSYVNPDKPPSQRAVATIVRKVALAMQEAHQSGIIHRDLKPANIMVDHRKEPIVMDFGLACPQDIGDESRLTQDGSLLGSPAYMSPEQLKGRPDAIGFTSDVYSLGVVLYELLSGRLPFDSGGSTIAMIGQILTEEPIDLASLREEVNPALLEICAKAMAKNVDVRYPSMKEFAVALAKYQATSGDTASLGEPTSAVDISRIQLTEQSKLAKTLCDSGQFTAAVPILKQIIASPRGRGTKMQRWAVAALPQAEARITQDARRAETKAVQPTAVEDDLFANLPTASVASPATLNPHLVNRHSVQKKSSKSNKSNWLVLGVGMAAVALIIGVAIVFIAFRSDSSITMAGNPVNTTTSDPSDSHSLGTGAETPSPQPAKANESSKNESSKTVQPAESRDSAASGTSTRTSPASSPSSVSPFADDWLKRFDHNDDDHLDTNEIPPHETERFMNADADGDRKLSREELASLGPRDRGPRQLGPPGLGGPFPGRGRRMGLLDFDEDGDGRVALSDLPERHREMHLDDDRNKDGFLDQEEIAQIQRRGPGFRPGPQGRGRPGNFGENGPGAPGRRRP